jgi:hypothetical protein
MNCANEGHRPEIARFGSLILQVVARLAGRDRGSEELARQGDPNDPKGGAEQEELGNGSFKKSQLR